MQLHGQRGTWDRLAGIDPLWAVLSQPDKRDRRWDPDEFFATGAGEVAHAVATIRNLGFATGGRALDFGCGVGRLTEPLAGYFESVVGVDISARMIDLARQRNTAPENCEYLVNLNDDLSLFADHSFDFVYSSLTLQHIRPRLAKAYLAEFMRVLRAGGVLLFNLPSYRKGWRALVSPSWARFMRLCRVPVIEMHGIPHREVIRHLEAHNGKVVESQTCDCAGEGWVSYRYVAVRR